MGFEELLNELASDMNALRENLNAGEWNGARAAIEEMELDLGSIEQEIEMIDGAPEDDDEPEGDEDGDEEVDEFHEEEFEEEFD